MFRFIAGLASIALLFAFAGTAKASLDAGDVAKMVERIKAGKGAAAGGGMDDDLVQIFGFTIEQGITYYIDIKAHTCYLLARQGVTIVPCRIIKNGYPMVAPLITWEKDSFAE